MFGLGFGRRSRIVRFGTEFALRVVASDLTQALFVAFVLSAVFVVLTA